MGNYAPLYIVLAVVLGTQVIASSAWYYHRAADRVQTWASENDYTILQEEPRNLAKGPFFWTSGKWQAVFRVTVQTSDGYTRIGWVRCGSWWGGVMSDKVEARWDDEVG